MSTIPTPGEHLPPHPQPAESDICGLCGVGWYDGQPQHVEGCPNAPAVVEEALAEPKRTWPPQWYDTGSGPGVVQ